MNRRLHHILLAALFTMACSGSGDNVPPLDASADETPAIDVALEIGVETTVIDATADAEPDAPETTILKDVSLDLSGDDLQLPDATDLAQPDSEGVPDTTMDASAPDTIVEPPAVIPPQVPLVVITAPNFGYDFATDLNLVTIEGIARDDVVEVTWQTSEGQEGTAEGVETWAAANIPVSPGDNTITVTGITADGESGSDVIVVSSTPGVPFTGGLELSATVVAAGIPAEITASVLLSDTDGLLAGSVVLAHSADASTPGDVLCTLEEAEPGRFTGTFIAQMEAGTEWTVRGYATFGSDTWGTLPATIEAVETLSNSEVSGLLQLMVAAKEVYEAANPEFDPWGARDALAEMLSEADGITAVGLSSNDGYGVWAIAEPGIPLIFMANPPGTRGAGGGGAGPTLVYPAAGVGATKAQTHTARGPVGKVPPQHRADAANATKSTKAYFFAIYNDQFAPDDEVPELATDFTNHACPKFDVFSGINGAGTVNAIESSFDGGVQVISTHGDTFFSGAPAASQWGWKGPGAQVAILTREAVNAGSLQAQAIGLLSGQLVLDINSQFFAYLPSFVTTARAGNPMDNSLVYMGACRSSLNNTLGAAYLAAGAGYYVGYSEIVNSDYAHTRGKKFFAKMLDRQTTGTAYADMAAPWVPDEATTPAYPVAWGADNLYLGMGKMTNGGFEQGLNNWTSTGQGQAATGLKFSGVAGTEAPEGAQAAHMTILAPDANYHQLSYPACPIPGKEYKLKFKWQVVIKETSCTIDGPNWLNFRLDKDEGNEELWKKSWSDVCAISGDMGAAFWGTGWQDASITFTAPATATPANEKISFSVGGYNFKQWTGLIDDVRWE